MKTFKQIASEFLQLPEAQITDALTPHDIPDWDSMNYLLFIAALEKEYGVSLGMDEVLSAKSLGDVRAALGRVSSIGLVAYLLFPRALFGGPMEAFDILALPAGKAPPLPMMSSARFVMMLVVHDIRKGFRVAGRML